MKYHKTKIMTVSLSNDLGVDGQSGRYYISINSENVYSYRVEVESEVTPGETTYEVLTVGDSERVLEVETTDGSTPKLVKYNKKAKFSFGPCDLTERHLSFMFLRAQSVKT